MQRAGLSSRTTLGRGFELASRVPHHLRKMLDGGGGGGDEHDVIWMRDEDRRDLWLIQKRVPAIHLSTREVQSRVFDAPFSVGRGDTSDKTHARKPVSKLFRERVIKQHWMPWLPVADTFRRAYGVAPYFFVSIPSYDNGEEVDWVPHTPDPFSGRIGVRAKNHIKELVWQWGEDMHGRKRGQIDRSIFWISDPTHMPSLLGEYQSDLATLLPHWRYIETMTALNRRAAHRIATPMHFIEYHPDVGRSTGTGDGGNYLEGAGRSVHYAGGSQMLEAPQTNLERVNESRQNQLADLETQRTAESFLHLPGREGATIHISSAARQQAELSTFIANRPHLGQFVQSHQDSAVYPSNTFRLLPFERYVAGPPAPTPEPHLIEMMERFERMAASTSDFPLDMIMGRGTSGQSGGLAADTTMQDFVLNRMRALSRFYQGVVERALLQAYAPAFRRDKEQAASHITRAYGRKPNAADMIAIERALQIEVIFPITLVLSQEELDFYYSVRMITEEEYYRHSTVRAGLQRGNKPPPREFHAAAAAHFPIDPLVAEAKAKAQFAAPAGAGGAAAKSSSAAKSPKKRPRSESSATAKPAAKRAATASSTAKKTPKKKPSDTAAKPKKK